MVRLPRRKMAIPLLLDELHWLPKIKDQLPLPIPAPIRKGQPDSNIPCAWSIVPWFDGTNAGVQVPRASEMFRMVDFLQALHKLPCEGAPENSHRQSPLSEKMDFLTKAFEKLSSTTDLITSKIKQVLQHAIAAPLATSQVFIHGDLHPRNIVVHEQKLSAIIDWGDMTAGDASTDLASLWMLFSDDQLRIEALKKYGADHNQILRAKGWAIFFGTILTYAGLDTDPEYVQIGQYILENVNRSS